MTCELKVPVAWGHIAVKTWGDSANEAVIVLHGLLDNAGSFDTLIPLLPQNFYYIVVDLPGHGFSSHYTSSLPIYYVSFLVAIRNVTEYFKRDKYIFLGHSFGGRIAILYTQIYPEEVSKIALLDTGYTFPNPPGTYLKSLIEAHDFHQKTLSFKPEDTPSYTYEHIIHKIMNSRWLGSLTFEAAEQLGKRMIKQVGDDKYEFTYDKRLREIIYPSFSAEYIIEIFETSPVRCPAISVYTTGTMKHIKTDYQKSFIYLPNFELVEVEGHHHSHHTNPEVFAPILINFLSKQKNKL